MTANEMSLRQRKRQQTRQELISAAMRLFESKGYEQTTVAEIAGAAGVSVSHGLPGGRRRSDMALCDGGFGA